jgi:trehalose-phosphatase
MKHLFRAHKKIKEKTGNGQIFLFLDYDGTLAEIAAHPELAIISTGLKEILKEITRNKRFRLAIISGRSLPDIRKKIDLPGIIYSGNHGLEIEGGGIKYTNTVSAEFLYLLPLIKEKLVSTLNKYQGVIVEDKILTLTVHYRLAEKELLPKILADFNTTMQGYLQMHNVFVRKGKKILEVIPDIPWNKGRAVQWILENLQTAGSLYTPIYIGDDITDEDAFEVLKKDGITIFVGYCTDSKAQYYVRNIGEVAKFIRFLSSL